AAPGGPREREQGCRGGEDARRDRGRTHAEKQRRREPAEAEEGQADRAARRQTRAERRVVVVEVGRRGAAQRGGEKEDEAHGAGVGERSSRSARCCFHTAGRECVPWPRVSSLVGMRTYFPRFTRPISRSRIPSSGGFTWSS